MTLNGWNGYEQVTVLFPGGRFLVLGRLPSHYFDHGFQRVQAVAPSW